MNIKNKITDNQTRIISVLKKMEASLGSEIRKGDDSLRTEIRRGDNSLRAEIKRGDKAIRQEMLKIEERVENLEEGHKRIEDRLGSLESGQNSIISQMRQQHDKVMTAVSNFAGRVQNLEDENVVGTEHYRYHEKKISKLEAATQQV